MDRIIIIVILFLIICVVILINDVRKISDNFKKEHEVKFDVNHQYCSAYTNRISVNVTNQNIITIHDSIANKNYIYDTRCCMFVEYKSAAEYVLLLHEMEERRKELKKMNEEE